MAPDQSWLRGPSPKDHAKEAMFQGACIFGIGAIATLGTWFFFGVVWFITPIVAAIGAFRFLIGLIRYYSGWE
jgi:hypothetical protein